MNVVCTQQTRCEAAANAQEAATGEPSCKITVQHERCAQIQPSPSGSGRESGADPGLVAQGAGIGEPPPQLAEHPGGQVQSQYVIDPCLLQVGHQRAGAAPDVQNPGPWPEPGHGADDAVQPLRGGGQSILKSRRPCLTCFSIR